MQAIFGEVRQKAFKMISLACNRRSPGTHWRLQYHLEEKKYGNITQGSLCKRFFLIEQSGQGPFCLCREPIWAQKRFRFILASPGACYHMIRKIMAKFCFILTVNGSWSPWSSWQACSATCGDGIQMRTRVCKSPEPTNGGYSCEGENVDVKPCTVRRCREYSGCYFNGFVVIDQAWLVWRRSSYIWTIG